MCVFSKQKTAYEMRISDWSSDVCSSDLRGVQRCRKSQPEHIARLRGVDDAIVPQARGGVIGVALILIFLADRRLEGFGFLRRPFVGVAVDGDRKSVV